eukprot:CAMPEP_0178707664 /NCGR_PEP_ID=MMETSP0699-20121125/16189_1 /TAXON_ID=265572 /ORGANISM="Extubocellulus spinifer, Strain CCMP396" /LENGTH=43 /DNA_ID= /DNA_START= /DNA_END= /DNA_ORIENTATION=
MSRIASMPIELRILAYVNALPTTCALAAAAAAAVAAADATLVA